MANGSEGIVRADLRVDGQPVNENAFKGRLLTYHYKRRAESSIGIGERYILDKAYFGTTDLVEKNPTGGWNIKDIPLDFELDDLLTNFAEAPLMPSMPENSTSILMAIHLNDRELPQGSMLDFNTLVLVDKEGNAFAVLCVQQETLYNGRAFSAYLTIEQKEA